MTDTVPDLDALIEAARIAAAQKRSMDAAAAEVIRILAESEGSMPLDDLLAAGAPRDVVAYLVADDATDRRRKQRAHLGFVGRTAVVWLSTTGWQAAGMSRRAGTPPTAQTLQHAMAPSRLRQWLDQRTASLAAQGIAVRCVHGAACRRWSADLTASAWGALRVSADSDGLLGSLTGGLIPDALVIERFPSGDLGHQLHHRLRGPKSASDGDLAETTYARGDRGLPEGSGASAGQGRSAGGCLREVAGGPRRAVDRPHPRGGRSAPRPRCRLRPAADAAAGGGAGRRPRGRRRRWGQAPLVPDQSSTGCLTRWPHPANGVTDEPVSASSASGWGSFHRTDHARAI